MSTIISYDNFITLLNEFKIKKIEFSVLNYSHYKKCVIETKRDILKNGNIVPLILLHLTTDGKEDISFYQKFNESYKIFNMGRKGFFTLRQLWERIDVHKIEYC